MCTGCVQFGFVVRGIRCVVRILLSTCSQGSLKRHEIYKQKSLCFLQSFLQTCNLCFYVCPINPSDTCAYTALVYLKFFPPRSILFYIINKFFLLETVSFVHSNSGTIGRLFYGLSAIPRFILNTLLSLLSLHYHRILYCIQ